MGCEENSCDTNQGPVHYPYINEYYIDQTEVTNADYVVFLNFLKEQNESCSFNGQQWPCGLGGGYEGGVHQVWGVWEVMGGQAAYPIRKITWYGAYAFCQWQGKRLPTEAEWEKAARSTDGRLYPWGDSAVSCDLVAGAFECMGTKVVGSKSPQGDSPYGVSDLSGNALEWVADKYAYGYYGVSPTQNPQGSSQGSDSYTDRVLRGGPCTGWANIDDSYYFYSSYRDHKEPALQSPLVGFRCAASQWE